LHALAVLVVSGGRAGPAPRAAGRRPASFPGT